MSLDSHYFTVLYQYQISKGKCRPVNHQIYVQLQEIKITELKTKVQNDWEQSIFWEIKPLDPTDMQEFQKTVDKIMENRLTKDN